MPGYWDMLAKSPGTGQVGANFMSAYLAARQAKQAEQAHALSTEYQKFQMEHQKQESARADRQYNAEQERNTRIKELRSGVAQAGPDSQANLAALAQEAPEDAYLKYVGEQNKANYQANQDAANAIKPNDEIARAVVNRLGLQPGTPEFQAAYSGEQRRQEALSIARAREGAPKIDVGGSNLAPTVLADEQKAYLANKKLIPLVQKYKETIAQLGGFGGETGIMDAAGDVINSLRDKAAGGSNPELAKTVALNKEVDRLRRQITEKIREREIAKGGGRNVEDLNSRLKDLVPSQFGSPTEEAALADSIINDSQSEIEGFESLTGGAGNRTEPPTSATIPDLTTRAAPSRAQPPTFVLGQDVSTDVRPNRNPQTPKSRVPAINEIIAGLDAQVDALVESGVPVDEAKQRVIRGKAQP